MEGHLIKGANTFIPTVPLRIAVRGWLDASALLLTGDGAVRGDQDVVSPGAPAHPSGAVRLAGGANGTAWLEVELPAVEPDIERVLVVGSTRGGTVRETGEPSVEAYAPDGTPVARYAVTEIGDEKALVLAELYRRAGGWKFRAVGQGHEAGLDALAAGHAAGPVRMQPPVQDAVPAAAPAPAAAAATPAAAPTPVPAAPAPAPAPTLVEPGPTPAAPPVADWTFGPVFEPHLITGQDNDVIQVNGLPPGPVVVELLVQGDGWTCLAPLNKRNKEGDTLVNSTEEDFEGRLLTTVPPGGPLRLRLQAEGRWQVTVLPLTAARRLTGAWLEGRGPDVLLHTGGPADFAIQYKGDSNLIVNRFEPAGSDDPTALPREENFINEIGARRETHPLPGGPLVVRMEMADGPWRARLKGFGPEDAPDPVAAVPFTAPVPLSGQSPAKTAGGRKASRWGWRGRS
ncbi:TerD family protein [Streptomyces sp. NPDC050400]|uniref:TerD family protein n=1 Tax=Streptomyces sp. NPDC050400 TaxID=3365610 RepID=UPI0037B63A08